jgi:hypothetical protein
VLTLPSPSVCV